MARQSAPKPLTEARLLGMAIATLSLFRDWAATGMYSVEDQGRAWAILATLREWEALKKEKGETP